MTRHCSVVFRIYKLALLFIIIAVTPSVSIAAHPRQMHALSPATQAAAATQSFTFWRAQTYDSGGQLAWTVSEIAVLQ